MALNSWQVCTLIREVIYKYVMILIVLAWNLCGYKSFSLFGIKNNYFGFFLLKKDYLPVSDGLHRLNYIF